MSAACRIAALGVAWDYRTVSNIALSVVLGNVPSESASAIKEGPVREQGRAQPVGDHQNLSKMATKIRFSQKTKGRCIYRIILVVGRWVSTKHGFITFHLTQVLTGLESFCCYLLRILVYSSAEGPACPMMDENVLFRCPWFAGKGNISKPSEVDPWLSRTSARACSSRRKVGIWWRHSLNP